MLMTPQLVTTPYFQWAPKNGKHDRDLFVVAMVTTLVNLMIENANMYFLE